MNRQLAESIVSNLLAIGVREWCACAGARNSPLFQVLLDRSDIRVTRFFEERSAAFYALGRMKADGNPVAVLTTSGTAAAELFPAVIEAFYSGLPLVAVTADRPRRYRGTGAPQSIEQVGIYGSYAAVSVDIEPGETLPPRAADARGVWHLNVCFEEPLLGDEAAATAPIVFSRKTAETGTEGPSALSKFLERSRRPLVVIGPLTPTEQAPVAAFVRALRAPVLVETASGLRGRVGENELLSGERVVFQQQPAIDGVLRLGGVPTCRLWRDLEGRLAALPVLSISSLPFTGLTRGELVASGAWLQPDRQSGWSPAELSSWIARDRKQRSALDTLLAEHPSSEPALVQAFSRLVPDDSPLYLGNSLPIREWDLAARGAWQTVGVNRGANGIDGQISTFLGFCRRDRANWALLGDLTTLYDLSAPWVLPQLPKLRFALGVMNNGGGQIFARMFERPEFQNRHRTGFEAWAAMWGLAYERWTEVPAAWTPEQPTVVEMLPNEEATNAFWRVHDGLWR